MELQSGGNPGQEVREQPRARMKEVLPFLHKPALVGFDVSIARESMPSWLSEATRPLKIMFSPGTCGSGWLEHCPLN